jgi:hypothetical protein
MIHEAVERTFAAGLLPSNEHSGITPLEECEAIARAIYTAGLAEENVAGAELVPPR